MSRNVTEILRTTLNNLAPKTRIVYQNHNNITESRLVTVFDVRIGTNEWYKESQTLIVAYCHSRQAVREFALSRILFAESIQKTQT